MGPGSYGKFFSQEEKENILISVKDSGVGIPKDVQPQIFKKFFRAKNAAKLESEGTGLGLYVNKMLAEAIGGKIWFESEEGKGTTFYVTLPKMACSCFSSFPDNRCVPFDNRVKGRNGVRLRVTALSPLRPLRHQHTR